jgi:hypothetical protein
MKKIVFLLAVLTILICSSAQAGSCVVPKFLKVGAQYEIYVGMLETTVTIVEIDKKSCWVRIKEDGGSWLNLNTIVSITPKTK